MNSLRICLFVILLHVTSSVLDLCHSAHCIFLCGDQVDGGDRAPCFEWGCVPVGHLPLSDSRGQIELV